MIVYVFNHARQPATAAVSLRLPAATYRASDIVEGTSVTLTRDGGFERFEVSLPPSAVHVVRITR